MPLFEDVENEDKHQSEFTNEGISISEKKNGWSPSPQKLILLKSQPTTTIFTSSSKLSSKSTSQEAFKGSSNKRLQYNQDENEQASGSELKRKNSVSRKKLFGNKSDDEHDVMLNDVVNSSEYRNISFENDSNEQGVVDISPRNINNSKRQNTHNISIAERDDLDEQLFSRPIGHNISNGTIKKNSLAAYNNSTEFVHNINDLLQSQNQQLRNITFLKYELKQVLSNQTVILDKLDQMEKYLGQNSFNKPVMEVNSVDFSDCPLPIDNTYDLQTFEDKISGDQSYKNQLITEISHIGGKNVKSVVKRLMSKLFSDSLLAELLLYG